ncbi:hypothetical protein FRC04_011103 [Tulasnella sp. 424]|nr:hypothetical protein FRC04_011103 [Tulasnella sp. 424]KAG8978418.1 hypothetical protein FRC05_010663 [Tulasnella sp. 425]
MKFSAGLAAVAASFAASGVTAVAEWGQCGGLTYTGSTVCDSPYVCVYSNPYYSQCLPATSSSTTTTKSSTTTTKSSTTTTKSSTTTTKSSTTTTKSSTTTTTTSSSPSATTKKFKLFGNIPGVLGTDYTWPATSSIDYFVGLGFNAFRVAFLMERLSPPANGLTGAFDPTYLAALESTVSYITGKGAYAIIDPHNFMRYNGSIISDTTAFTTWWKNLSALFKSNSHVIFDLQNEPNGIDASVIASQMQAAVNGIRAGGATNLILAEGTSWTGAWTWTSSGNAAAFVGFTDPANNFAIEMHQYLDSDGSGTSATCVSSTIGAERIADATTWLKNNNIKGFLGEIGAGSNDDCIAAVKGAFTAMQAADSPWIGALWWAAGPWWGDYYQSIEPPSGAAIARILPEAMEPFLPVTGL